MIHDGVWPLVSASEMQALDRHTIETLGVPGEVLMESAGRAVAEVVLAERAALAGGAAESVCVVCGGGNNGGDGLVIARQLHAVGVPVEVVLLGDPDRLSGDAAVNLQRARRAGVVVAQSEPVLPPRGIIVDAIFGTGLSRAVTGPAEAVIRTLNEARGYAEGRLRIVAVDLPSGLDADTGQVLGVAIEADVTVTISLPKAGLALEPGRSRAGRVVVARIGIADEAPDLALSTSLWSAFAAARALPARPSAGHKGSFGHVLVVAGSEGKTGAAALAALGAGRAGAGLVTIACPAGLNDVLEVKCTEAMTVPVADTPRRALAAVAEEAIVALARERDVVALGPGIGREEETCALVRALAKRLDVPLVIDADGLFALDPPALESREAPTVLTPHPGEAARLLGMDAAEINRDRLGAARRLAEATGAVAVLKGAATVVADASGRALVNPTGGPALASGGTGDVLTGIVAALLAQGLPAFEAAGAAVYLHGLAADRITDEEGPSGLLAAHLADALPATCRVLRHASPSSSHGSHEFAGEPSYSLALPFPGA